MSERIQYELTKSAENNLVLLSQMLRDEKPNYKPLYLETFGFHPTRLASLPVGKCSLAHLRFRYTSEMQFESVDLTLLSNEDDYADAMADVESRIRRWVLTANTNKQEEEPTMSKNTFMAGLSDFNELLQKAFKHAGSEKAYRAVFAGYPEEYLSSTEYLPSTPTTITRSIKLPLACRCALRVIRGRDDGSVMLDVIPYDLKGPVWNIATNELAKLMDITKTFLEDSHEELNPVIDQEIPSLAEHYKRDSEHRSKLGSSFGAKVAELLAEMESLLQTTNPNVINANGEVIPLSELHNYSRFTQSQSLAMSCVKNVDSFPINNDSKFSIVVATNLKVTNRHVPDGMNSVYSILSWELEQDGVVYGPLSPPNSLTLFMDTVEALTRINTHLQILTK